MRDRSRHEILEGLRHVRRWLTSEYCDDFCSSEEGSACDCGRVLCKDQVSAAVRFIRVAHDMVQDKKNP